MEKLKHTKNELKRQKDALKLYTRFLPTLILKKQQLQLEIGKIVHRIEDLKAKEAAFKERLHKWVAVFGEEIDIKGIIGIDKVHYKAGNIAGVDMPIFDKIDFKERSYDLIKTPLWVDYGIEAVKEFTTKIDLEYEVTPQRVEIVITDEGDGFDPQCVPDPTRDENLEKPGGRGIMLMRAFMDTVEFSERGNSVRLIKSRPGA